MILSSSQNQRFDEHPGTDDDLHASDLSGSVREITIRKEREDPTAVSLENGQTPLQLDECDFEIKLEPLRKNPKICHGRVFARGLSCQKIESRRWNPLSFRCSRFEPSEANLFARHNSFTRKTLK